MNAFEFSDRTLEDLERVQGANGAGRGKVDHRGNRALARDLGSIMRAPVQIAQGAAASKAARNTHALQQLARTANRAPQVVVKITSRVRGSSSTVGAMTYVGRIGMADKEPIGIETSEGKHLTDAQDMLALAREWHKWEMADDARRQGATAIAMVFSMPPGTDPEKVRDAVKDFAETDLSNRRWVMALHTDEAHPHVHLLIANRDNDGRRFNPNREFLQHCRERFAENLRERGIEADATKRMARGYPPKQDPNPVLKMRERGIIPDADKGMVVMLSGATPEAEDRLDKREKARTITAENAEIVRDIYNRAIAELEASGGAVEADRAKALRSFVDGMATPSPARIEIVERLKTGNALPKEYAKDAELERLKGRVQKREDTDRNTVLSRLEKARSQIKDMAAELRKPDPTKLANEAKPNMADRIREQAAELRASLTKSPDPIVKPSLSESHKRLLELQRQTEREIRDRDRMKEHNRTRDRDKDRGGPTR